MIPVDRFADRASVAFRRAGVDPVDTVLAGNPHLARVLAADILAKSAPVRRAGSLGTLPMVATTLFTR